MERVDRVYFAAALGLIAYGLAWLIAGVTEQPLLWYDPMEHSWVFSETGQSALAMDWYGRVLQGLVVGGLVGGAAWWALGKLRRLPGSLPWHAIVGAWAAGVILLCMFLYAFTLWQRTVYPPAPGSLPGF